MFMASDILEQVAVKGIQLPSTIINNKQQSVNLSSCCLLLIVSYKRSDVYNKCNYGCCVK